MLILFSSELDLVKPRCEVSYLMSLSVVGNITNIRRIAQKTTEPVPPNSDE
jgi:hypothetical protein